MWNISTAKGGADRKPASRSSTGTIGIQRAADRNPEYTGAADWDDCADQAEKKPRINTEKRGFVLRINLRKSAKSVDNLCFCWAARPATESLGQPVAVAFQAALSFAWFQKRKLSTDYSDFRRLVFFKWLGRKVKATDEPR